MHACRQAGRQGNMQTGNQTGMQVGRGAVGGEGGVRGKRTDGRADDGNSLDSIFEVPAKVIIFTKEQKKMTVHPNCS